MATRRLDLPPTTTRRTDPALVSTRAVLDALFGPPATRGFAVRYWTGAVDAPPAGAGAPFTLVLARPGALRRMLLPPSELAIAERYIYGDVDVEGELERAVSIGDGVAARLASVGAVARLATLVRALPDDDALAGGARVARALGRFGRRHALRRDRAAVRFHYDVGNDFYRLWLDERMVYSCAYFESGNESIDEAQVAKLDYVCRKLRLAPGERLLDIGCGWGALIEHAVRRYGVAALGITLSERQAEVARERAARAGIADRCEVAVIDYRALPTARRFDKIVSVGMVEHVGHGQLGRYFEQAFHHLEPGGLFLNHGIVGLDAARPARRLDWITRRLWKRDAFIDRYVFPDGRLVPAAEVLAAAEGAGFEMRDVESLREHYALTLRHWVRRLERAHDDAVAVAGEATYRVWRLYMSAAAHAFAGAHIGIIQTLLAKPDAAGGSGLPLTRASLYC